MSQLTTAGCFACIEEGLRRGLSIEQARKAAQHPIEELEAYSHIFLCKKHRPA